WKIIFLVPAQTRDVFARLFRNRRLSQEVLPGISARDIEVVCFAPGKRARIVHQSVGAESFFVEEYLGNSTQRAVEIPVQIFGEAGYINAKFFDHILRDFAIGLRALD